MAQMRNLTEIENVLKESNSGAKNELNVKCNRDCQQQN
jgi:hypothetical protein